MATMVIGSGTLTEIGLNKLYGKVFDMNKRAKKLGKDDIIVNIVTTKEEVRIHHGLKRRVKYFDVEVVGDMPVINGWQLIARIEFADGMTLINKVPGVEGELFEQYASVNPVCDHCKIIRRRNDIFVLRHDDGREKIVGRNCLADYIRSNDAKYLIFIANFIGDIQDFYDPDEYFGSYKLDIPYNIKDVLEVTSICIRKLGWMSKSSANHGDEHSTASVVFDLLNPPNHPDALAKWKKWREKNELYITELDSEVAIQALEWVLNVEVTSDYLYNIKEIASNGDVINNHLGYACSILNSYIGKVNRDEKKNSENKTKSYLPGDGRQKGVKVQCKSLNHFEGAYGVITIINFEHIDNNGNICPIVWKASGDKSSEFERGEFYTADMTIKDKCDHHKYGIQTMVNRVKIS